MELLHAAGITQAVLLALYFFRRRAEPGNLFEAALLLTVAASILIGWLYGTQRILEFPNLARSGFTFMSLIGPLLFWSVRSREIGDNRLHRRDALFALVPIGITAYLIPFHLSSTEAKLQYLREDLIAIHLDCIIILYLSLLNNFAAFAAALYRLFQSGASALRASGAIGLARQNFFFYLIPSLILLIGAGVSALSPQLLNSGLFSGMASLIALSRSYILLYNQQTETPADAMYPPALKYQKALLPEERVQTLGRKLADYFSEEQPYLEPDFALNDAARKIDCSPVQASQIINRHFGKSFVQLCQDLRIQTAQELLRTRPESFSILDIALESGFNSKSVFNAAFKKHVGETPSGWRARESRRAERAPDSAASRRPDADGARDPAGDKGDAANGRNRAKPAHSAQAQNVQRAAKDQDAREQ
jgi:AraC-like DNA-binding protein